MSCGRPSQKTEEIGLWKITSGVERKRKQIQRTTEFGGRENVRIESEHREVDMCNSELCLELALRVAVSVLEGGEMVRVLRSEEVL